MNKLIPVFRDTILDTSLSDALADLAEVGIDAVLDFEPFKSIPIVSTLVGYAQAAQNIRERNLLIQTAEFFDAFKKGSIDDEALSEYRIKLQADPRRAEKELGRVIVLLDRSTESVKSRVLGRLYRSFVFGRLSWEDFFELTDAVDRAFVIDFSYLTRVFDGEVTDTSGENGYRAERLYALGLISRTMMRMTGEHTLYYVSTTRFGGDLVRYGLREA